MFGVSTPTFVTPDTRANAQLQHWSLQERGALLLRQPARPARPRLDHAAALDEDAVEPARGRLLQLRPVPARRRAGDAVLVRPRVGRRARACRGCRCARPTTTSATRWSPRSPSRTSSSTSWLQVQTDPFLMPIENNAVLWPTKLSPRVPAAVLRIPKQTFDSPEQLDFARRAHLQPVALDRRAPPARQPEPGPEADVLRALAATPADERASSTTSRPATRRSRLSPPIPAR